MDERIKAHEPPPTCPAEVKAKLARVAAKGLRVPLADVERAWGLPITPRPVPTGLL